LLSLEKLIREYRLDRDIDLSKINESQFSVNLKIKSDYYRIYSLFIARSGDQKLAKSFIEKAIQLNPEKFSNYDVRLLFLGEDLLLNTNLKENQKDVDIFFDEIEKVRQKFSE